MKNLQVLLKISLRSLAARKLRSFLSILGIVFGVVSVIVMLAIGEGASQTAQDRIMGLGATTIFLKSVKPAPGTREVNDNFLLEYGLTLDDFQRILPSHLDVEKAIGFRTFDRKSSFGAESISVSFVGTSESFFDWYNIRPGEGRLFSTFDEAANVCVVGAEVASKLFGFRSPINNSITIDDKLFHVIGVALPQAAVEEFGEINSLDLDNSVFVRLESDFLNFGRSVRIESAGFSSQERLELSQVNIAVQDVKKVESVAESVGELVRVFHEDDVAIEVPMRLLAEAEQTKRLFNAVLGSIAIVSLLVGGIGIMNIMLANVTERSREIGIRRSLGAKQKDIVMQFVFETLTLCLIGTVVGTAAGVFIPNFVTALSGMNTQVTLSSVIWSNGFAILSGLVFSIYPAVRASKLDPIEAMRMS